MPIANLKFAGVNTDAMANIATDAEAEDEVGTGDWKVARTRRLESLRHMQTGPAPCPFLPLDSFFFFGRYMIENRLLFLRKLVTVWQSCNGLF
ncbi:MAG TPA: hypothetical protein VF988_08800 [Verrucomicrobiae bacterium]